MPVPGRGGGGGGVRRHNRSLSRGWNKTESCPGGIYKSIPGRWRYNISFYRGAFIYCPEMGGGEGGGRGTFAIIVICSGVRLNKGIAHSTNNMSLYNCCMDHMLRTQCFHSCDVCTYGHVCAAINTVYTYGPSHAIPTQ